MAKIDVEPAQNMPELKEKKDLKRKKEKKAKTLISNGTAKYTIIGILTAIGVILLAFALTFTIVLKSNAAGLADKYRTSISGIPVLKYALPKAADPEDPKNFSQSELIDKYNTLKKEKQQFQAKEKDLNSQIAELLKYKADEEKRISDAEASKAEVESLKKAADDASAKLESDKKAFEVLIANADKQGFKTYYESVSKDTAQKIYAEIITQQKISDDTKKYVQIYEQMDTSSVAKIFEQMGKSQMDLVIEILKNMSKDKVSKILPEMSTEFAAKVSEKLSAVYMQK